MNLVLYIFVGVMCGGAMSLFMDFKICMLILSLCMFTEYIVSKPDTKYKSCDYIYEFCGISEKLVMIFIVILAQRFDILFDTDYIAFMAAAGFMAKEINSVINSFDRTIA